MRNLKIGLRLLLSYLVLVIAACMIWWAGQHANAKLEGQLSAIADVNLRSLQVLDDIKLDLEEIIAARRAMLIPATTPEFKQEQQGRVKKSAQDLDRALALFEKLQPERSQKWQEFLAERSKFDKLVDQLSQKTAEWQQDPGDILLQMEVLALAAVDLRKSETAILGIVDEFIANNDADVQKKNAAAKAAAAAARTTSLAVLAGALLLALAAGWLITRSIIVPLQQGVEFAEAMANGDYTHTLPAGHKDEIGALAGALNSMGRTLSRNIEEIHAKSLEAEEKARIAEKASAEAQDACKLAERAKHDGMLQAAAKLEGVVEIVTSASQELSSQIEESSRGSEQQSRRVAETAAAMEEMNATVQEVANNAGQAASTADTAKQRAVEGQKVVGEVVSGIAQVQAQALALKADMDVLGRQAQGIGQILNVISDIADQTNLLALNAAIEAARAGDAGRGFAVVADEVRKLAEKTQAATKEVGDAITAIQDGARKNVDNVDRAVAAIEKATELANTSGSALQEIVALVQAATEQVQTIATASREQTTASEEINHSVEEISTISAETAQAMNQAAQAVAELAEQATVLKGLIEELEAS